jgi:hypothetical protein
MPLSPAKISSTSTRSAADRRNADKARQSRSTAFRARLRRMRAANRRTDALLAACARFIANRIELVRDKLRTERPDAPRCTKTSEPERTRSSPLPQPLSYLEALKAAALRKAVLDASAKAGPPPA